MQYGIVIYPNKEVLDRTNSLRKRYDSHYSLIPPHVTLIEPFESENEEEVIRHLESVVKEIPPFHLSINKIKSFIPTTPVLYFAFEQNEMLHKLNQSLNTGILKHEPKYQYIPHLTFAQNLPDQELHDIYGRLHLKDFKMDFPVDRIHLCYQIENGSWVAHQTFLLQGQQ